MRSYEPTDENKETGAGFWGVFYFLMKVFFLGCMVLQTMLWPCAMTIIILCVLSIETILTLVFGNGKTYVMSGLTDYGVFLLRNKTPKAGLYIYSAFFGIYTLAFFLLFTSREMHSLPRATQWIHPHYIRNYSFTETKNNEFRGLGVRDEAARFMREHPFVWPREATVAGLRINGTLPQVNPGGMRCGVNFECYASKHAVSRDAPAWPRHSVVPFPSQFYTTDVIIAPPARTPCGSLEAYRIVYDADRNVEYGLDYPASASPSGAATLYPPKCDLFGVGAMCLLFSHPFSDQEYSDTIQKKCTEGGGKLVFRLPPRSVDIEPETGRMGIDVLLVTSGAEVSFRHTWHDRSKETELLSNWGKWTEHAATDGLQTWRDSTDSGAVFIRYVIAITPFLMMWMYLAVHFETMVQGSSVSQVLLLSIFVLLPASLLFFVVGAWIPLAGCIVCIIAINSSVYFPVTRIILLCITLLCNVVQFVFILVVIALAGFEAFMYEDSLQQIQDQLGGVAFLSGTPTWLGLILPSTLVVNGGFALGAVACIVYETYSACVHGKGYSRVPRDVNYVVPV